MHFFIEAFYSTAFFLIVSFSLAEVSLFFISYLRMYFLCSLLNICFAILKDLFDFYEIWFSCWTNFDKGSEEERERAKCDAYSRF